MAALSCVKLQLYGEGKSKETKLITCAIGNWENKKEKQRFYDK